MSERPARNASLGGAAARGGLVLGAAGIIETVAQFLRAIILARILAPGDFGLMGMAFVAIQAGESLSQTGFHRALVQKRGDASTYLDTVWVVSALRGIALVGLAWLIAPLVGAFFETPAVVPILRAVGLVYLINGFLNPAMFLLEKELRFVRFSAPRVAGVLADLVASVAITAWLRTVWGMVLGFLVGKAVYVIASYLARPYRPALRLQRAQAAEFYRYGRHIFRGVAADYLVSQADKALIGRLLGAHDLGLYSFAWRIATLPSTGLFKVVFRVAFPVFSHVQEEEARMRSGFLKALALTAAMAAPMSAGLWSVSADLVVVVFGAKWLEMIPCFEVLCLAGIWLSLCYLIGAILSGVGRPEITAQGTYVLLAATVIPIYPAIRAGGILGAAWCVGFGAIAAFVYVLLAGARVMRCELRECLTVLAPPLLGAAGMAAMVALARAGLGDGAGPAGRLLLGVVVGVVAYPALTYLLDRGFDSGLLTSVRSVLRAS